MIFIVEDLAMRPVTYQKTREGEIRVGGVPLRDLAQEFGTPLYVMDYQTLMENIARYRQALEGWGTAYYAGKAFCCRAMVELVDRQGLGLDVVSGGELFTALTAGLDPGRVLFHGNVKTAAEIRAGLEVGVGHFVVDSLDELHQLDEAARAMGRTAAVLLRLTPGIEAHTHEFVRTGQFDSKFGFAIAEGIADQAVAVALRMENIELKGFHAHIGSQILDTEPFVANAEALLTFSGQALQQFGFWPEVLDLGGGIGVRYGESDDPPDVTDLMTRVRIALRELTPRGMHPPHIIIEPGRSIVAEAGLTLYTVEAVKTVPGGREYIAVDGGMGDNIRPALYQAQYAAELDQKAGDTPERPVTVAGRYCETGDILIPSIRLPDPARGDLLAVWGTGAYNYAMASSYNRVPRPAVVLVNDGEASLWVDRERWDDLTRRDRPLRPA